MATTQQSEPQHLLIRVRLAEQSPVCAGNCLALDVEAQVNRSSIYPAGRVDLDLLQLRKLEHAPGNEYGRLLGQKLCGSLPLQNAIVNLSRAAYLRIQIMLEPPGFPLSLIRWERLEFNSLGVKGPLALVQQTPLSRFAAVNREESEPPADAGFHMLVFAASPAGLPAVDAALEFQTLKDACGGLLDKGWLELTFAPGFRGLTDLQRQQLSHPKVHIADGPATLENLAALLAGKNEFTALHAIAHGRFAGNAFQLMLEAGDGELMPAKSEALISSWNLPALRLIYLQSCQSGISADEAGNDPRPHVTGFMHQLVEAGVPGVIAMQDNILMEDAGRFCQGFYASLLQDGLADAAVNAGRSRIQSGSVQAGDSGARWSIPAFATRLVDASLWVVSPLRTAQQRLARRIEGNWRACSFRELPIDVAVTGKAALEKENVAGVDQLNLVARQSSFLVTAKLALHEAATADGIPPFTCLIGPRGRAKKQLLERVFLDCLDSSSSTDGRNVSRACVMLRLSDCAHPAYDPLTTIARAVATYHENSTGAVLDLPSLVARMEHESFVFLVQGDENVGRNVAEGLQLLGRFMDNEEARKRHRFILTLDQNELCVSNLPEDARCLLIQPMCAERVREFLRSEDAGAAGRKLLQVLEEFALFDLAEAPWLLNEMLDQARRGTLKQSRAGILGRVIDDGIARFTGSSVTANRVREALQRFAWEVQNRRDYFLPERQAYEILQELRGNRDYPLFGFLSEMIDSCNILASVTEEGIGFNYPGFRSYCAANYLACQDPARRRDLLEDITAQLGRQSRADNWSETLYVLAGLWDGAAELLSMILSGSLIHQGEQLYIAARCLQEARLRSGNALWNEPIVHSIVGSLLQVASPGLRSVATRRKAIAHLGPLREPKAIRPLASIVLDKRRSINQSGQEALLYDYSGARLGAMQALAFSKEAFHRAVLKDPEWSQIPNIQDFFLAWNSCSYQPLGRLLESASDPVSDMAAFSLAMARAEGAFDLLTRCFDSSDLQTEALWPITDALLELSDPRMARFIACRLDREDRCEVVAHMIGRMGQAAEGSRECGFLWSHLESPNRKLAGRCLIALGELSCADALPVCRSWLTSKPPNNSYFALQALRGVGEWKDLKLIERLQWNSLRDDPNKRLFLDSVRTEVYDTIYWRLAGGLSREVMTSPRLTAVKQTGSPKPTQTRPAKTMKAGG